MPLRFEPGPVARLALVILATACARTAWCGTGTVTAQGSVNTFCTVATTGLSFGAYDPIVANTTADLNNGTTGSVAITCVKGTAATIALGNGANYSGTTRRMKHATTPTEFLSYQLYVPSTTAPDAPCNFPGVTPWIGATVLAPGSAPNKNSRSFNVCGTVPAGQDVEVGAYSDTVVVTVTF